MRIDLHCHSTYSDGAESPRHVFDRAQKARVDLFCLTDHDTWTGCAEVAANAPQDLQVLHGAELSCRMDRRSVHLLIYRNRPFDSDSAETKKLRSRLDWLKKARDDRFAEMIAKLAEIGLPIEQDIDSFVGDDRVLGRPLLAQALVDAGHCSSLDEAFRRYLSDGGPAYVPSPYIDLEEGLALGEAVGAKMSLAHPHTAKEESLVRDWFRRFRDRGLEGIEAFYGQYTKSQRQAWLRIAQEFNLVATGGSDFHGGKSHLRGPMGVEIPELWADKLRSWLD